MCCKHVVSIRKFRLLLQNPGQDTSLITAEIQTVSRLVDDVKATLEGLVDIGTAFRNLHAAYSVIRNLVERDLLSMLNPGAHGPLAEAQVWVGPTADEMDVLRGKLEPENDEYKRAVEKFLYDGKPMDFAKWLDSWRGGRTERK